MKNRIRSFVYPFSFLVAAQIMSAPETRAQQQEVEDLVVVGSRIAPRAIHDSNVPVDVISSADIARTQVTETARLIQTLVPSFNFSVSTVSDGTDAVRPATLRSLYPDQLLVLVNGKRRHNSALLHVNGSVGRGSAGVDLNAIPPAAIERIEVLRDGAAAQYGSDAIAGIINIVLKEQTDMNEAQVYVGQTTLGDGEQQRLSFNGTLPLARGGFVNLTLERRDRDPTNRAGKDRRCQYVESGNFPDDCGADPREVAFERRSHRIGDAESDNDYLFFNAETPLGDTAEFYAFGGISRRDTEAGGFYRRAADDGRNNLNIYPDGFLPLIATDIEDRSLAAGVKFEFAEWKADVSAHYGENTFDFNVKNSHNVTLGDDSPREAYSGGFEFEQLTFKADATRHFDLSDFSFDLAVGYEYRRDGYRLNAGELVSYQKGSILGTPGIQVFPGFRPENEVDVRRRNNSLYIDVESWLSKRLNLAAALRWEDYSDFGEDINGKLSARYEMSEALALRGAASSGFRAPSLSQQYFNNISTQFTGGVAREVLTAHNKSDFVAAIGGKALAEESALNLSFGFVAKPMPNLTITADAYRVEISDRIVLSRQIKEDDIQLGAFTAAVRAAVMNDYSISFDDVQGIQFFANAMDTVTRGLDIVIDYDHPLDNGARLDLTAALNFNKTRRDGDIDNVPGLRDKIDPLYNDIEAYLEKGSPRQRYSFTANYHERNSDWTFRLNYYGSVASIADTEPQRYDGRWLTDIEYTHRYDERTDLIVGAHNIFDVTPEKNSDANRYGSAGGSFVYSRRVSPFGFNGGFLFTSLRMRF